MHTIPPCSSVSTSPAYPQCHATHLNSSDELWIKTYGRSFLIRFCDSNITRSSPSPPLPPFVQNYTCTVVLAERWLIQWPLAARASHSIRNPRDGEGASNGNHSTDYWGRPKNVIRVHDRGSDALFMQPSQNCKIRRGRERRT